MNGAHSPAAIPGLEVAQATGSRFDSPRRVAFVVNTDRGFVTHRATWALALQSAGAQVRVYAPDTGYADRIRRLGIEFHPLDLGREDVSAMKAVFAAVRLFLSLLAFRPGVVFLVQTAAYTIGWPAAAVLTRSRFIRVAGGVGRALQDSDRPSTLVRLSLRLGARCRNILTLFQLAGDKERFVRDRLAVEERTRVIAGTGVDLAAWSPTKPIADRDVVLFASRLYEEKGVRQFVDVARQIDLPDVRFVVVGEPDHGVKSSITEAELLEWVDQGYVEWWGHQEDMVAVLQRAKLLIFPSRHPEGTPKTLIEAASCGVPVIASDQEGCRSVVEDGASGWIRGALDVQAIADTAREALSDADLLQAFADAARKKALEEFDLTPVLERILLLSGSVRRSQEGEV